MKTIMRSTGLALPILIAFAFTLGIGSRTAFSGGGPKEVIGFGEYKTLPFITLNKLKGGTHANKSFGKKSVGAIGDTVGNRVSVAFGATKDAKDTVQGQMFLRDHDLNLTISTNIVKLIPHPEHRDVVGVKAHGLNYIVRIESSKTSVVLNGKPHDGYFKMFMFDGDKDQVCATLRNSDNKKIYQWVGFMSSGDVKTK